MPKKQTKVGLMFPKPKDCKKQKKQYSNGKKEYPSIIPYNWKGVCYLCGRRGFTHEHHIFGGNNRKKSGEYGLKVYLCPECHEGNVSAHKDREIAQKLHAVGQQEFEKRWGSREEFRRIFGKSYLEDE